MWSLLRQGLRGELLRDARVRLIYHRQYRTREKTTQDIFEYIEVFYNRLRRHSTLGYYSPVKFEARTAGA
ncbi:MAG: IS3 family transposase [Nitrospirota bacterium]|nr:IS3 family transposase [Nitrospirota bacterium]